MGKGFTISRELWMIIEEAAKTLAIQRITSDQKRELAMHYNHLTDDTLNIYCSNCIIKACIKIYNEIGTYEKQ